jgi:RNA polymerase sigma-70 factor (ECF subfamily)
MPTADLVPDDAALLERVAGGDRRAFDSFLARHHQAMARFAHALARSSVVAEDALQDAFVSAWRGAAGYHGPATPRAWMYAIVRNSVARQFRRKVGEDEVSLDQLGADAGWGDAGTGDRVARALEDRDRVGKALEGLSSESQEVLLLVDVEGLALEEASAALDVSVAAVKSRLHRARLRFVAELKKEDDHAL